MKLKDSTIYDEKIKNAIRADFSDNIFDYDELNFLLPDYFHDIKMSNLYGLYFSSEIEKRNLIAKKDLTNIPLSFFKENINSEFGDFANNKETYLRQLKLDENKAQELLELYKVDLKTAEDPLYCKNLVKLNMIEKTNKSDLLKKYNQIFFNKKTISLHEMNLAYSIVVELIKNNFEYSHQELLVLLAPILNNIPLTFLTLIEFFFTKEVDSSNIPEIWNTLSEKNMNLLELREGIINNSDNKKFYVDLEGLPKDIPFYSSVENDIDCTEHFLKSITSNSLSKQAIDFLVSLSEWLYKYDWQDYEPIVEKTLKNNNIASDFFETEFYNFCVKRILDEY